MVAAQKIAIVETKSSSTYLYSIVFIALVATFLWYWYWFSINFGPWYPSVADDTLFSSTDFDARYPDATQTLTIPKKFINGRVYFLDELAKEASRTTPSPGYVVVIIPAATTLKVGNFVTFNASQSLVDSSANKNLTQYFGIYENTGVDTEFNDAYFAILNTNKNYPNTPASHSDKLRENEIMLQVFDFGAGNVWVAFGGFSDA